MENKQTPTIPIAAVRNGLGNAICHFETNGLFRRTLLAADAHLKNYQQDLAVMRKMAEYIEKQDSVIPCDVCINEPLIEVYSGDVPDDVEPCKFKRENGCKACVDGIIEYFKSKS